MLVKELQSLALNIRVLDKNGEEIELSTLCNEEEVSPYSNRAEEALLDDVLDNSVETDDLDESFLIEDAEDVLDSEDGFGDELGDVFEDFVGGDEDDNM